MAEVESDFLMSFSRSKKRKILSSNSASTKNEVSSEHLTDGSSATFLIEDEDGKIASAKKSKWLKDSTDVNHNSNNSISTSSSSSSSSSSGIERVSVINESKPLTALETVSTMETASTATNLSRTMSVESKMRRQALKNRTLKCSACTAGNDAEYIHQVLSIPICGNCNKNVLDDTFGRAENGQELRCTWCGDGELNK